MNGVNCFILLYTIENKMDFLIEDVSTDMNLCFMLFFFQSVIAQPSVDSIFHISPLTCRAPLGRSGSCNLQNLQ